MKAKDKTQAATAAKVPATERDAGYQYAVLRDSGASIVEWMLDKHPDFAESVSSEVKDALYEGFTLRFHENQGQDVYIKGDTGALILAGNTVKAKAVNGQVLKRVDTMPANSCAYGIHQVQAYTPQQRGMLKTSDPALHSILQPIQTAFSKYASNTLADMQRQAAKILAARSGETRTREMVLFWQSLESKFDALEKQVKNAEKRKDETANAVRFKLARDAFVKTYNAK